MNIAQARFDPSKEAGDPGRAFIDLRMQLQEISDLQTFLRNPENIASERIRETVRSLKENLARGEIDLLKLVQL